MVNENKLLSQLNLGSFKMRNRIIFGAHATNFAKNNLLADKHIAYYRERAKGGAGMIVIEEQLVHPSDLPYEKAVFGWMDDNVSQYRRIAEAVHNYGSLVVAQLNHSGMQSEGSTSMHELWAPSAVPDVVSREVPKVMEENDIGEVVAGFAKVAEDVLAGGFDGVEINASQFSLIRQFMSCLTNQRTDHYGGDLTNRLRFCINVLNSVRTVLGKEKLLGIRICGDEFAPWGGLTPQDAVIIAKELESLNVLDYITVSVGSLYSLHLSAATYYSKPGLSVDIAVKIKEVVKLPVFAEGRIHHSEYAARIVTEGLVDGVYMNRALICDPELPNKLNNDEGNRVRECLSCNQGCQVRRSMGKPLSCIINPLVGVEHREENIEIKPASFSKKVLVIGGGSGGMEAARVASLRGHRVILWEAESNLGGKLALNNDINEFSRLLEYWKEELLFQRVTIITAKKCELKDIISEAPDVVILATGSVQIRPNITVNDCLCLSALEVAKSSKKLGKNILFWDEIGDQLMARAVTKILNDGCKISFVTPDLFAGDKLAGTMELSVWNQRLMSGATEIYTSSFIKKISGTEAIIENKFSGKILKLEGIDAFIHNCWPKPNDNLYITLKEQDFPVYRIGDCLAPRGIGAAVREGYLLGRSL